MLSKIKMPSGGTNTDQLLVVSWKKKAGDAVKRGDILLEVETDKALLEVESFAQGTLLKRLVEEGSYGTVGDVIAYIGDPEDLTALETESAPEQAYRRWPRTSSLRLGRQRWQRRYRNRRPLLRLRPTPQTEQSRRHPQRKKKPAIAGSIWRRYIVVSAKKFCDVAM